MRPLWLWSLLWAALLCLEGPHPPAAAQPSAATLHVVAGQLVLTGVDGTPLPPTALLGVELPVGSPGAGAALTRITALRPDPRAPDGPITLYDVALYQPATGQWAPLCTPDPEGHAWALPVTGTWTADGRYVPLPPGQWTWTCTAGAHAKCLRWGYWPWATTASGESLVPYLQACTRMMRADYCGDGTPQTVPGIPVQLLDRAGLAPPATRPYGTFEAAWGPEGAVCVHHTRVPVLMSLPTLGQTCPRLATQVGAACTADTVWTHPTARLGNYSVPGPVAP